LDLLFAKIGRESVYDRDYNRDAEGTEPFDFHFVELGRDPFPKRRSAG
jgi:hypothetical protein